MGSMSQPKPDVITSQTLATGTHYYSQAQHLREKHLLEGDTFVRWVLDHITDWESATILDAGGAWGRFIWSLLDNYHVYAENIVLTDLSHGMLQTANDEAHNRNISIKTTVCNIESLPFESNQFDVVMANKVLYHLQDMDKGIQELARVLKPDGTLLATTNSGKIKAMIIAFHYQALDALSIPYEPEPPSTFSMENGGAMLSKQFRKVETYYYEAETLIDSAAEVRATYETIGRYRNLLNRDARAKDLPDVVEQLAQATLDRDGVIKSPELMGVFVCTEPKHF
jgi:ubiquinone/menaquinone biosynthesis C-methylase UbiE